MSENQHTHNTNPLATPLTVDRNGITATLTIFTGKRDAWKDKQYQAFQVQTDGTDSKVSDDTAFQTCLDWFGKENVKNALNTISRRYGQDFVDDATGDEETEKAGGLKAGIFSKEKFLDFWSKLKSSAMRLSELLETHQQAVDEYMAFTTGELMDAMTSGDEKRIFTAKAKMDSMNNTLRSIKADLEERKARRSKEKQADTVTAE